MSKSRFRLLIVLKIAGPLESHALTAAFVSFKFANKRIQAMEVELPITLTRKK